MPPSLARTIAPRALEVTGPHPHIHTYTAEASTVIPPQLDTVKDSAHHRFSVYGLRFQNKPALAEKAAKLFTIE
jgi:hypothetical protein